MSKTIAAGPSPEKTLSEHDLWKGGVESLKRVPIHAMHPRCVGMAFVPDSAESISEDGHWIAANEMKIVTMVTIPVGHFQRVTREVRLASVHRLEQHGGILRTVPDPELSWDFRWQPSHRVKVNDKEVTAGSGLARDTLNSHKHPRLFRILNRVQEAMTATGFMHSRLWRERVQQSGKCPPPLVCGDVTLKSPAGTSPDFDMPTLYVTCPMEDRRKLMRAAFEVQCQTVSCRADFISFVGYKKLVSIEVVREALGHDGRDLVRSVNNTYWDMVRTHGEQSVRDRHLAWFESRAVDLEAAGRKLCCIPYRLVADYAVKCSLPIEPVAWHLSSRTQQYFDAGSEAFILPPVKQMDWRQLRLDAQSIDVHLAVDPRISLEPLTRPEPRVKPEVSEETVIAAANPQPILDKPADKRKRHKHKAKSTTQPVSQPVPQPVCDPKTQQRVETLLGVEAGHEPEPKHYVRRRSRAVSKKRRLEIAAALQKAEEKNALAKSLGIG